MLRLRPSELTLTSDDVEETFRRMSLRQSVSAPTKILPRPCGQPGRLTLRRGPERSTRDAITSLGNIPILQPQQAVFTSVDEDVEDVQDIPNDSEASTDRANNAPDIALSVRQGPEESARTLGSPSPRTFNLPFRLGRERRHRVTQSCPDEQRIDIPRTPPPGPPGQAPSGARGTNSPVNNMPNSPPSRSAASANSTSGLRGGGSLPRNGRTEEEASGDLTKSPSNSPPPTLYLQGFFTDPTTHPEGLSYDFHEQLVPHTEPRRHVPRQPEITRSLSSGGTPSFLLPNQRPIPPITSTGDVFGTAPASEPRQGPRHGSSGFLNHQYYPSNSSIYNTCDESFQADRPNAGSRQFSSDASAASAGYSYYGSLNSSRVPSSEQSVSGLQLDGAAPSFVPNAPRPYTNYNHISVSGQHGPSPRPSSPYTRVQDSGTYLYPPPGFGHMPRGVSGAHMDAAVAAANGLYSPLEGISREYLPPSFSRYGQQVGHGQAPRGSNNFQGHPPYLAPTSSGLPQYPLRSVQRSSEHLANSAPYGHPSYGRGSHAPRGQHRPSENAPDMPTSQQGRPVFNSYVQTQRAAYERLGAGRNSSHPVRSAEAQPYRHSMPHRISPFDMTNRSQELRSLVGATHNDLLSGPFPVFNPRQPQADSPSIPPRQGFRQHSGENPQRTQTRRHAQLQPPRDRPQTSLALDHGTGITSRLSRSPVVPPARTYRRVPPEQRDQENDGDRSLMRREEANVNTRYGEEEQQRSTIDDTPPGIGRVERRMMD